MRLRVEGASKGDLLGTEEWSSFSPSALFSAKPATARGDGAFRLGDRAAALDGSEVPPLPAHLQQQGTPIHYEAIYRAVSTVRSRRAPARISATRRARAIALPRGRCCSTPSRASTTS